MRNDTRARFNTYVSGLATANGIGDAAKKFAVTPSVQQRLWKPRFSSPASSSSESTSFPSTK
jgi:hypothetical protein